MTSSSWALWPAMITPSATLFRRLPVGYMGSEMDFDNRGGRSGASVDYSGWQLAAYGGYDDSVLYARGVWRRAGMMATAAARSTTAPTPARWRAVPTATSIPSTARRAGAMPRRPRLATPYAGLNLATATLEGFTEDDDDGAGAALRLDNSDGQSVETTLGLRFEAPLPAGDGILTPALSEACS